MPILEGDYNMLRVFDGCFETFTSTGPMRLIACQEHGTNNFVEYNGFWRIKFLALTIIEGLSVQAPTLLLRLSPGSEASL